MADQNQLDFFFGSNADIIQYETIEISSDPLNPGTLLFVRNADDGIVLTTEHGPQTFTYLPMRIRPGEIRNNLGFSIDIDIALSDGNAMTNYARGWSAGPTTQSLVYRVFRSDQPTTMMFGPIILDIKESVINADGMTVTAQSRELNRNRTGRLYTFERFEGLRGFVQ